MPDIFVIDDQHPEDTAMLQALYSRSPASVTVHLEKLKTSDSGKFMDQYYVGYGHASIGDCATTTIFVEQVSMLVAKAIQDNPLYNGQEASTRYLDFTRQATIDPYNAPTSAAILSRWKEIYAHTLPKVAEGLQKRYAFDPTAYKTEKIWQNAVNARAFDICRSLLPIGTTTLLSWTTSLRAARDHLRRLKFHPLPEVRDIAQKIFKALIERYPHSFNASDMNIGTTPREAYLTRFALRNSFVTPDDIQRQFGPTHREMRQIKKGDIVVRASSIDLDAFNKTEADILALRPPYTPLPWRLEAYGRYNLLFLIDFGSFRDLQRHRNGVCQIPLVGAEFGINAWYLEQFAENLSPSDGEQLRSDIESQFAAIQALDKQGLPVSPALDQYLFPMGTQVLVHTSYSVPEIVYVGELRSGKTVHPSLRPIAQKMLDVLKKDFPGIALYGDMDEDSWTAKRGEQTIAAK